MRLVTFEQAGVRQVGVELADDVIANVTAGTGGVVATMMDLLKMGDAGTAAATSVVSSGEHRVNKSDVRMLAPIYGPEKVICIGMNYVDHCTEQNMPVPTEPLIFNKFPSCIIAPGEGINCDKETAELDFEVELAVVIGKTVPRHTSEADAGKYIAGYTVAHDVSARDWQLQKNGGQWLLGKTFDTYAPLGPAIVTPDELDLADLRVTCRLNGKTVQDSSTKQLVFSPQQCIAWIAQFCTLKPGDVIQTGTPPGVGCFRKPQLWMKAGDVCECEIEGIGSISNPIV